MTMTRWNRHPGPRLAALGLVCAAVVSSGCMHPTPVPDPHPAREAEAMTPPGADVSVENPTLTAEEIGRRFLELIRGLESRDQLSLDRIREVMGIVIPHKPGALRAGVGSDDLGGGWHYVLNYVPGSPSNAKGIALSFVNQGQRFAGMEQVCELDFDAYHNALLAMGYRHVAIPGEIGELRSMRYHKGDITLSMVLRSLNAPEAGRLCVESIGTLN